ncbi:MAG TPA: class I SAM-dependent methyltransferase [Polyangiaceae bacterium]|nr:class I SAM-dependent methyltransferase [Polyangiaceae bacterium]
MGGSKVKNGTLANPREKRLSIGPAVEPHGVRVYLICRMETQAPSAKEGHYAQKSRGYHIGSARAERVLDLVGGPGYHVLDVACGGGHIGALIRERGNTVVGAEISEAAAAEARPLLDSVHVFDIESPWPSLGEKKFDRIVLGEVLEHVFDPVAVLGEASRVLSDNGRLIVTTPNFLVWIARLQVLFGRFRYQRYGLFDFGHIRWFTYAYLKEVVEAAGYVIEDERHVGHPKRLTALAGSWPSLFAMNFVIAARRKSVGAVQHG